MRGKRLLWLSAGVAAGSYVVHRHRQNGSVEPPGLTDAADQPLEPIPVELDGGEIVDVVVAGEGPPLLLIPGLSGDKEVFRYQVAGLSDRYRVIACDLRQGFQGVEEDFDQFAHDVARILDAVGESSVVVLGLSFGGPIAMRFATLYPERTRALIVTNTLSHLDLGHVGLNRTLLIPVALLSTRYLPKALARRLAEFWGRLGVWVFDPSPGNSRVLEYYLSSPIRVPVSEGTSRMDAFRERDLRPELPAIDVPALVIRGGSDSYCLAEWQEEIARLLPHSSYVEIPDAGHLALISHPDVFNRTVSTWLQERALGPAPASNAAESA